MTRILTSLKFCKADALLLASVRSQYHQIKRQRMTNFEHKASLEIKYPTIVSRSHPRRAMPTQQA
jgi:hypothetical protein